MNVKAKDLAERLHFANDQIRQTLEFIEHRDFNDPREIENSRRTLIDGIEIIYWVESILECIDD